MTQFNSCHFQIEDLFLLSSVHWNAKSLCNVLVLVVLVKDDLVLDRRDKGHPPCPLYPPQATPSAPHSQHTQSRKSSFPAKTNWRNRFKTGLKPVWAQVAA